MRSGRPAATRWVTFESALQARLRARPAPPTEVPRFAFRGLGPQNPTTAMDDTQPAGACRAWNAVASSMSVPVRVLRRAAVNWTRAAGAARYCRGSLPSVARCLLFRPGYTIRS
jgi:hypothetical protein